MDMNQLCASCQYRPIYPGHSFCSKTCASKATIKVPTSIMRDGDATTIPFSNLCNNCHRRPRFCDPTSGELYSFCGKLCAALFKATNATTLTLDLCENCKQRPKFSDPATGKLHPYCGQNCAALSAALHVLEAVQSRVTDSAPNIPPGICQIPGCNKPTFGPDSDFCGMRHRDLGTTMCLWCRQKPQFMDSAFCGKTCMHVAEGQGPILVQIPRGHKMYKSVREQFTKSWRHPKKNCPAVKGIYRIILSESSRQAYEAYRASVEVRGHFTAQGKSAGNQNRRWHGTQRQCDVGDNGKTSLCQQGNCAMCSIIKTSFQVKRAQGNISFGRFGAGIYTSSTSSKSDDYSSNGSTRNSKAMFLSYVVVGKGHKLTKDQTNLTSAPAGYDSVSVCLVTKYLLLMYC
ncbi:hypothetical protein H2248_008172 [Termitomyces sp. 'cryptogamus']|nr:hypothetical protein H2248_008172 [Termitomyces sp. 'cryptogamus']